MIETPHIVTTRAEHLAVIALKIPREEMFRVIGPGLIEIHEAIATQQLKITGPWLTHHLAMDPATFDFEICVPVAAPVEPIGRVSPGLLPAMRMARTVYHGEYEHLGDAWGEFMTWIESQAYAPAADLWECYLLGPDACENAADYRTQLSRPIALAEEAGRSS